MQRKDFGQATEAAFLTLHARHLCNWSHGNQSDPPTQQQQQTSQVSNIKRWRTRDWRVQAKLGCRVRVHGCVRSVLCLHCGVGEV